MEYVLGIGTRLVEKYKKNPNIQIFINGILEDEFVISNTEQSVSEHSFARNWKENLYSDVVGMKEEIKRSFHVPKSMKLFYLNSEKLKPGTLQIKVDNADSNYTNGFMTKSTTIQMYPIFLIPASMLEKNTLHKLYTSIEDGANRFDKTDKHINYSLNSFRNFIENEDPVWEWPVITRYLVNGQSKNSFSILGGSFAIEFDIYKKHGLYAIKNKDDEPKGYPLFNQNAMAILNTLAGKLK